MRKRTLWIVVVLLVAAAGVAFFVFKSDGEEETEEVVQNERKPRRELPKRTQEELRERMRERAPQTRPNTEELRREIARKRDEDNTSRYQPGQAQASIKSRNQLDELMEKKEKNASLTDQTRATFEEILEGEGMEVATLNRTDCIDEFCRVVFKHDDNKGISTFLKGLEESSAATEKYRFTLTESKLHVTAPEDIKAGAIPMETRFYFSNSDEPLPIDEKLQKEPEA